MIAFKPKRGIKNTLISYAILTVAYAPVFIALIYNQGSLEAWQYFIGICYGFVSLLFLFISYTTKYWITDETFHYTSAFFLRGDIEISRIYKLEVNKTSWVGKKPATATKGIIIHFNKYDDVYVSPQNNIAVVEALLAINTNIDVQIK